LTLTQFEVVRDVLYEKLTIGFKYVLF